MMGDSDFSKVSEMMESIVVVAPVILLVSVAVGVGAILLVLFVHLRFMIRLEQQDERRDSH